MTYHGKVKGEQVTTFQMAQQLKTKNINAVLVCGAPNFSLKILLLFLSKLKALF